MTNKYDKILIFSSSVIYEEKGVNILHAGQHDYKSTPIYIGHCMQSVFSDTSK